jgi:hypothetical protein
MHGMEDRNSNAGRGKGFSLFTLMIITTLELNDSSSATGSIGEGIEAWKYPLAEV